MFRVQECYSSDTDAAAGAAAGAATGAAGATALIFATTHVVAKIVAVAAAAPAAAAAAAAPSDPATFWQSPGPLALGTLMVSIDLYPLRGCTHFSVGPSHPQSKHQYDQTTLPR